MGRTRDKKKSKDGVARDLSSTIKKSATTPTSAAKSPASSPKKTGKGPSSLARESNLSETPHCKSSKEISFVCSSLISDNLNFF